METEFKIIPFDEIHLWNNTSVIPPSSPIEVKPGNMNWILVATCIFALIILAYGIYKATQKPKLTENE